MSRCGDCIKYKDCLHECRDLSENETFYEVGGCGAFRSKEEHTYNFLPFSLRRELTELYEEWTIKNNAKNCAFNVISFLAGKKLIDIERAINFINQEKEKQDDEIKNKT